MKKTISLLLTGILSVMPLHSKASCAIAASFKENYAHNSHHGNVIFIKGIALGIVDNGRHIKVIEDLKGNFTGDSIISVWGKVGPSFDGDCISSNRLDDLLTYQENDTLIMLVRSVTAVDCVEVSGGYATFDCAISVLKLSNDYVTGHIDPYIWGRPWEATTMPWDELQQFLANDGFVNAFEAQRAEWSYLYACGSAPYTLYKTILYGDTVIDGVNWKIVTGLFMGEEKGLVRTDKGKKVIFRGYPGYAYSDKEIILYDFSLNVGDSMIHYQDNKMEILEIDSIVLDYGKKHKRMKFGSSIAAIEGVGLVDLHPFYMLLHLPTCASGPFLVCCEVNRGLLYKNPLYADCYGALVSNETVSNISQKARITFFDGRLRVTFDDETLFDVELYNLQGMLLAQTKNNRNEMLANLDYLPKGVYIVRVSLGNYAYSEKIVK